MPAYLYVTGAGGRSHSAWITPGRQSGPEKQVRPAAALHLLPPPPGPAEPHFENVRYCTHFRTISYTRFSNGRSAFADGDGARTG